jgi:hypothetical protein
MPGQSKSNGFAITSLIMGLIGCFALTSIGAIIFGALGIRKANREPQAGGKGMSIAGIVLGIVWIIILSLFSGAIIALFSGTKPQREMARSFVTALSAGDVATAKQYVTSEITKEELAATAAQAKSWGTLTDTTAVGASINVKSGESVSIIGVAAEHGKTQKSWQIEMVKEGETWKIRNYTVQ